MAKPPLPELYIDEHIKQGVVDTFTEQGFKCLLIANTRKYAERNEEDYIEEIYPEGRVFVTSDVNFFHHLLDNKKRHAGVVLIPPRLTDDEYILGAFELAGLLRACLVKVRVRTVSYAVINRKRGKERHASYSW